MMSVNRCHLSTLFAFFFLECLGRVYASVQVTWPVFNRDNNTETNSRRKLEGKERNIATGGVGGLREEARMSPLSATLPDCARKTWLRYLQLEFKWTLKD
jgi:hypothetical protein